MLTKRSKSLRAPKRHRYSFHRRRHAWINERSPACCRRARQMAASSHYHHVGKGHAGWQPDATRQSVYSKAVANSGGRYCPPQFWDRVIVRDRTWWIIAPSRDVRSQLHSPETWRDLIWKTSMAISREPDGMRHVTKLMVWDHRPIRGVDR